MSIDSNTAKVTNGIFEKIAKFEPDKFDLSTRERLNEYKTKFIRLYNEIRTQIKMVISQYFGVQSNELELWINYNSYMSIQGLIGDENKDKVLSDHRLKDNFPPKKTSELLREYIGGQDGSENNLTLNQYFIEDPRCSKINIDFNKNESKINWNFEFGNEKYTYTYEFDKPFNGEEKETKNRVEESSFFKDFWIKYNQNFYEKAFGITKEKDSNGYFVQNIHWNLSYPNSNDYLGSINLFSTKEIEEDKQKEFESQLLPNLMLVFLILNKLEFVYIDGVHKFELKTSYRKAAITAIMGRNMSHNIGSHVIYYLRQHLNGDISKITELLQDFVDVKVQNDGKVNVSLNVGSGEKIGKEVDLSELNNIDLPFLKGLGTFFTYIQERQDFIAALSSGYKPSFSSVNFKSFIIDNFLRDLQSKRHSGNNIAKKEDNILLKFIVKSEGKNVVFTLNDNLLDTNKALDVDNDIHKFSIDIPGGTLGRQAFYSILENLIRNAAKHGNKSSKELRLDISISREYNYLTLQQAKLITGKNHLLETDYIEQIKDNEDIKKWKQSYYQIRIKDNNSSPKELAKQLRESLQRDLIDEKNGKLVENEKGLKEIVISALWLNGLSITDVSKENRLKYIDVEVSEQGELEYIFYVTKSKEVLFVVADNNNAESLKNLIKQGLNEYAVITKSTFELQIEECSRYSLVVDIDGVVDKKYNNKLRRYLNCKESISKAEKGSNKKAYDEAYKYIFNKDNVTIDKNFLRSLISDNFETNSQDLYLFFYHWYIKDSFYVDTEFPNIVLNIEDNKDKKSETVELKANHYKDLYLNKCKGDAEIKLDDNIYVPYKGNDFNSKRKLIAFRRHMHNDVSEFFDKTDDKQYFQNSNNADFIGDNGILTKAKEQYLSVESITGDNSSFRILTNEEKDDLWTLKKIEAAAAKVLIIDERIYDNSVFYQEGGINEESQKEIRQILGQFFKDPNNEKLEKIDINKIDAPLIKQIWNRDNTSYFSKEEIKEEVESLKILGHTKRDYREVTSKIKKMVKYSSKNINISKCLLNHLKNIEIANVEKEGSIITDFKEKLADIMYNGNNFALSNKREVQYSYISIHQGILDKLYKIGCENNLDKEQKQEYTKQLVGIFQEEFNAIKVVIHTGRGKPNYIKGIASYRSLSDLDYALSEPKELLLNYFESASYEF